MGDFLRAVDSLFFFFFFFSLLNIIFNDLTYHFWMRNFRHAWRLFALSFISFLLLEFVFFSSHFSLREIHFYSIVQVSEKKKDKRRWEKLPIEDNAHSAICRFYVPASVSIKDVLHFIAFNQGCNHLKNSEAEEFYNLRTAMNPQTSSFIFWKLPGSIKLLKNEIAYSNVSKIKNRK